MYNLTCKRCKEFSIIQLLAVIFVKSLKGLSYKYFSMETMNLYMVNNTIWRQNCFVISPSSDFKPKYPGVSYGN